MISILFNPKRGERHTFEMLVVGFFYASLSIILSIWVFPGSGASLAMVFLSVLSCLYVVQGAIKLEEKKEKDCNSEGWVLREHLKPLMFLLMLFIGFVIAFSVWSFVLSPEKMMSVFEMQSNSVNHIRSLTGNATMEGPLFFIIINNVKVMVVSLIFALFYGAGSIFILAWNASIMGFVIGNLARDTFGVIAFPIAFTKYFLHGIPEMFAYIIAALGGGILYVSFLKGDLFKKGRTKRILIDVGLMMLIALFIIFLAALIEVYISPFI